MIGQKFFHKKTGHVYLVTDLVKHHETSEQMVVYKNAESGESFVRELASWQDPPDRFVPVPMEFHHRRQMFAVFAGTVLVAPKDYGHTHTEWFVNLFGSHIAEYMIQAAPRGYVLDGKMMIYRGPNFDHHGLTEAAKRALEVMGPVTRIGFGAKVGNTQPWEARTEMSVEEFNK